MTVTSSRVAELLHAARTRAGWSRETLAHHSGVSWSAIAQIESGRRKDVRLSSLTALAASLDVSVDYLIGNAAAITPDLFEHRVLLYGSDAEFLAGVLPFLTEGVDRSHAVLVVTARAHIGLLRDALADRTERVEIADSSDWYTSPRAALERYRAFVKQQFEAGSPWIRVVGEPVWAGLSDAEITAWTRYESMINLVFAAAPATLICPYDTSSVPEGIVADARRTHPEIAHGIDATTSPTYHPAEDLLLEP